MSAREFGEVSYREVLPALYGELRKIACKTMERLPPGCTLQPTALVHEAWLRLETTEDVRWQSQVHYLAAAADTMRHILIDRARRRRAARHGGTFERIDIEQLEIPVHADDDEQMIAVSDAVEKLAVEHPEAAELAKLRLFGGLDIPQAALILGVPRTTAYRRWKFATSWLTRDLRDASESSVRHKRAVARSARLPTDRR